MSESGRSLSKIGGGRGGALKVITRILLRCLGLVLLSLFVVAATTTAFFVLTPEFVISGAQLRWLVETFTPDTVEMEFHEAEIRIRNPGSLHHGVFGKRIILSASQFCARYQENAVQTCFSEMRAGATLGWGGPRTPGESRWLPHLIELDPIRLLEGKTRIDMAALSARSSQPETRDEPNGNELEWVEGLRTRILPRWRVAGSRIELDEFFLKTDTNSYRASFLLTTLDRGRTVQATLFQFESESGEPRFQGVLSLTRPRDWRSADRRARESEPESKTENSWRLRADLGADFKGPMGIGLVGEADIYDWNRVDFRLGTYWQGVSTLERVMLNGGLRGSALDGVFSLKMGKAGARLQALDFVNCGLSADLRSQVGELQCGPQTVRVRVKDTGVVTRAGLRTVFPEFVLRMNRLKFGDRKEAQVSLRIQMNHENLVRFATDLEGEFIKAPGESLQYQVGGDVNLVLPKFQNIVAILRDTPYAVPAPLNVLDGAIGFRVSALMNEEGGDLTYESATRLDSVHQAVHLNLSGRTHIETKDQELKPSTEIDLGIEKLEVSAPRLSLNVPPRLRPDTRFGPIGEDPFREKEKAESEPMNFRMRIRTTRPQAIRLATNLTKNAIPIEMNLVYDDRAPAPPEEAAPGRAPASILAKRIRVEPPPSSKEGSGGRDEKPSPVTGTVVIGETGIELFKRNAVLNQVKFDLLPSGSQRVDGKATVRYLDYDIFVLLSGEVSDPQVKLASDPPLEDNQILSVLLFGRPFGELDEEEQSSVSNLNAAFTDAVLGISSLYVLASTPIESVGYDAERQMVTAKVGLGGGASVELGSRGDSLSGIGFRKRLSRDFVLRSDVERIGTTGKRTVSAFLEWVRRF